MATSLVWGSWNVICDVCGFKFKAYQLRKRWDGKMVCKDDWEIRHPQDLIKVPKDDQSVPWSRPEQTDVFADVNYGKYLSLPGIAGNYASTPDSAAASIVGDIDIRCRISVPNWAPASGKILVSKRIGAIAASTSYVFYLETSGLLALVWSTGAAILSVGSTTTLANTAVGSILWVRVTLDVDNGAGGYSVTFYTSPNGTTWTQFGAVTTAAGITSIQNDISQVEIGTQIVGTNSPMTGSVYYADIRNVIDGTTPVVKFDPSNDAIDLSNTFTSSTGEVWTINQSGTQLAELKYTNIEDPIPSGSFTTNNGTL